MSAHHSLARFPGGLAARHILRLEQAPADIRRVGGRGAACSALGGGLRKRSHGNHAGRPAHRGSRVAGIAGGLLRPQRKPCRPHHPAVCSSHGHRRKGELRRDSRSGHHASGGGSKLSGRRILCSGPRWPGRCGGDAGPLAASHLGQSQAGLVQQTAHGSASQAAPGRWSTPQKHWRKAICPTLWKG